MSEWLADRYCLLLSSLEPRHTNGKRAGNLGERSQASRDAGASVEKPGQKLSPTVKPVKPVKPVERVAVLLHLLDGPGIPFRAETLADAPIGVVGKGGSGGSPAAPWAHGPDWIIQMRAEIEQQADPDPPSCCGFDGARSRQGQS